VYFGAVGIKNTRYTVGAMLLADLVGITVSILMAYLFFGLFILRLIIKFYSKLNFAVSLFISSIEIKLFFDKFLTDNFYL
jgi:hypothetical protein